MSARILPEQTGCAAARRSRAEPLLATAPERAVGWLLLEHPGPWPGTGLPPDLPAEVTRVWESATHAGVRCQLIRPVQERRSSPATVFVAGTRPGAAWLERRTLHDLTELADLDVSALADGRQPHFGADSEDRVVLVCTHGRRDVCCARLGRPVAMRLDRWLPGLVWETSHVGGHRFAGNVVALPDGSYHGGVTDSDIERLADAVQNGRVFPARLRGRAGLPAAVQAADYYARIRCGVQRLEGVVPIGHAPSGTGETVRVDLEVDLAGRYSVYVRPRRLAEIPPSSCDRSGGGIPVTYELVAMHARNHTGHVEVGTADRQSSPAGLARLGQEDVRDRMAETSPRLMGILNVNGDSFSDPRHGVGGEREIARLTQLGVGLWQAGADLVDVGAESASPATPVVDAPVEVEALIPVLAGLHRAGVTTSVDTYKPDVAKACVDAGTAVINDYSGLVHPEIAGICADSGVRLVLTHNPAGVKNKVLDPRGYTDVVDDVASWFETKLAVIEAHGLPRERVLLDPGIDLAKTPAQSIELLRGLSLLASLDLPLLVAVSRKDFIGAVSPSRPAERDAGTLAAVGSLSKLPRVIVRVHDVAAVRQYLDVANALSGRTPIDPELSLPLEHRRQAS